MPSEVTAWACSACGAPWATQKEAAQCERRPEYRPADVGDFVLCRDGVVRKVLEVKPRGDRDYTHKSWYRLDPLYPAEPCDEDTDIDPNWVTDWAFVCNQWSGEVVKGDAAWALTRPSLADVRAAEEELEQAELREQART